MAAKKKEIDSIETEVNREIDSIETEVNREIESQENELKKEIEVLKAKLDMAIGENMLTKLKDNMDYNTNLENTEFMALAKNCIKYDEMMLHIKLMTKHNEENYPLSYIRRAKTRAFIRMTEIAKEEGIISRFEFAMKKRGNKFKAANDGADKQETYEPKSSGGGE